MNPRDVYKLYLDFLPKQKFFAKYIKAKNDDSEKFAPKLIELVSVQERWSRSETIENLSFITSTKEGSQTLKDYLKLYGISEDEAKKVYKIS
jgi:N-glycosylase/DNA lyase